MDALVRTQLALRMLAFNSSIPSAAKCWQRIGSALVQIMACRLFADKPLSKPMLGYCSLDPWEQIQCSFNRNSNIFVQENVFENVVYEMASILSRYRCVFRLPEIPEDSPGIQVNDENIHLPIRVAGFSCSYICYRASSGVSNIIETW